MKKGHLTKIPWYWRNNRFLRNHGIFICVSSYRLLRISIFVIFLE